jgi:hypothetical protein
MPDGRVLWFDERSGDARIEHLGREYPVRVEEMEPDARVAGATVHFDIDRRDGVERARHVELVPGLRTSVHQHRRGEVTHAQPDEAGHRAMSRRRPWHEERYERAPAHAIAEDWLRHVRNGELDDAAATYAPDAIIHVGAVETAGREAARRALVACSLFAHPEPSVGLEDEENAVVIGWGSAEGVSAGVTRLRVSHGEIVEQWLPEARTER